MPAGRLWVSDSAGENCVLGNVHLPPIYTGGLRVTGMSAKVRPAE